VLTPRETGASANYSPEVGITTGILPWQTGRELENHGRFSFLICSEGDVTGRIQIESFRVGHTDRRSKFPVSRFTKDYREPAISGLPPIRPSVEGMLSSVRMARAATRLSGPSPSSRNCQDSRTNRLMLIAN